jgi:hypothetical protein
MIKVPPRGPRKDLRVVIIATTSSNIRKVQTFLLIYLTVIGIDKTYNNNSQSSASKAEQPLSNQDNYANKGHKNDNYNNAYNKQKSYPRSRRESRDYAPTVWKRKHAKVPKDFILEFYHKTVANKEMEELAASVGQLFKKDKQVPVNHEPFTLNPNEGLIPKPAPAHTQTGGSNQHNPTNQTSTAHTSGTNTANTSMTNLPATHITPVHKPVDKMKSPPVNTSQTQPAEMFDFPTDDPILGKNKKIFFLWINLFF